MKPKKQKETNPKCPKCDGRTIKYGTRNGKQRYRCRHCSCTFYNPELQEYKYTRNTKRILSLLFNMLDKDFFGAEDLEQALHPTEKYYKQAKKIQFNTKVLEFKTKKEVKIGCYKAKLLICQDDKSITFIPIPPYTCSDSEEYGRKIIIYDNEKDAEYNKKWNKPFVKNSKQKF